MRGTWFTAAAALLVAWAAPGVGAAELPFALATAEYRTLARERVFDGEIEAVHQSTVSAQTAGRITDIYFDVDDYVPKDAVILRVRDTEQRARLTQAQAALHEAQARFGEAQAEHDRIRDVFERKLVAQAAMDKASAELNSARARLEAAQARVSEAQEQLEHTVVRAPFAGIVTARHVEVGESANLGQPLMSGVSLETLRASVEVPGELAGMLREGGRARIDLPALGVSLEATELTVFPFADPRTRSFKVRVALPAGEQGLFPGMLVKVAFAVGEQERLLVPVQALVYRSELTGVYVVDADGRVALRQVRIGRSYDGDVEVLAGLAAGERVALDPVRAGVLLKEQAAGHPS
jgi:RND family efflux transporter MFP subunit